MVTIQKSSSGAYFTIQNPGDVVRYYTVNDYDLIPTGDNISLSLIRKRRTGINGALAPDDIILNQHFTNVTNGDTSSIFASYSAYEAYVLTNFFRNPNVTPGGGVWGTITGTLSDQTDLQSALNAKQNSLGFTPYNATNPSGYISDNQSITLSGDISGTGTTAITTTIGAAKVTNAMLAGSITAAKLVGTDITTIGTLSAGSIPYSLVTGGPAATNPGGSTKQIQFNDGGVFAGNANFVFNKATNSTYLGSPVAYVAPSGSITFIGTSITLGTGASSLSLRYSSLVSTALGLTEINQGASGQVVEQRNPPGGSNNFISNEASVTAYSAGVTQWLVVETGPNDWAGGYANYTPTNYTTDLTTFINYCTGTKGWPAGKILILSNSYVNSAAYGTTGAGGGTLLSATYQQFITNTQTVATNLGTLYFNVFDWFSNRGGSANLVDNLHPNNIGHSLQASGLLTVLAPGLVYTTGQSLGVVGQSEFQNIKLNTPSVLADGFSILGRDTNNNLGIINSIPANMRFAGPIYGPMNFSSLSIPAAPGLTPSSSGGSLVTATYYYKWVAVDIIGGLSIAGLESSTSVTGPTGSVATTLVAVSGAASYRLYRGTTSGGQTGYLPVTINSLTTVTFTDTGAALTTGTPPSVNTSAVFNITNDGKINGVNWGYGPANIVTNIAIGALTLGANVSSGGNCIAIGYNAGQNSTAAQNVFLGSSAGVSTGAASLVTLVGYNAGNANAGPQNTIVGGGSGIAGTSGGGYNTIVGTQAMTNMTGATSNCAFGVNTLLSVTSGGTNSAYGTQALYSIQSTSNNVAVGYSAGRYISGGSTANTTGANSTFLGTQAYPLANGDTNEIVVGYLATGHGSNTATWGNGSITDHYFTGTIRGTSGTATKVFTAGGKIKEYFADAGNTTTTETDLYSYITEAGILGANGASIQAEYGGTFVSSATATRDLKVYFGGTVIFDSGALTISTTAQWAIYVSIIRVSSTVVRYMVSLSADGVTLTAPVSSGEVTGLTLSGTNILKITGQAAATGAATNDIVGKLGAVYYWPVSI